jgi:glycerol uptake facilitator-like aquaporin
MLGQTRKLTYLPTGGHFNPAVTLCLAYWQGFPWRKVPYYILSQIFGSFMAALFVMGMYREQILALEAGFRLEGLPLVMNGGPASIFCSFPLASQHNLGYLFMIEWYAILRNPHYNLC